MEDSQSARNHAIMSNRAADLIGKTAWLVRQFGKQIWVRAALFSVAAVAIVLLAAIVGPYIPYNLNLTLAAGSVDHILDILASSMLAVTTFSLSIMVSAYSAATSNVTPRSTKLLLADPVAQNTLATFVGSFLFSIVGVIGLAAGIYSDKGRIILFFATLFVLFVIVATLLRWIEQLGKFGRVGDTIIRVEDATVPAFRQAGATPRLGARAQVPFPSAAQSAFADRTGMVVHIDAAALDDLACKHEVVVHIASMPGSLVHPGRPILYVAPSVDKAALEAFCACVTVGNDREFDQDPRFGLIVLSEIASRALSPAVNDPGTAIEVLHAGLRVLLALADAVDETEPVKHERVHAPDLDIDDLFRSFFNPIARDASALAEVQIRMTTVLAALAQRNALLFGEAVRREARELFIRSNQSLVSEGDRRMVETRIHQLLDNDHIAPGGANSPDALD